MKYIKRLIESNETSKLREVVDGIKAILIEFEDSNIISYNGNSTGNYDKYIDNLTRKKLDADHIVIECTIEIPTLNEEGSLKESGIDVLEDILIAIKRLKHLGYVVSINLNRNFYLYKPCAISIKIPINLL